MLKRVLAYLLLLMAFAISWFYGLMGVPALLVPLLCLVSYTILATASPWMRRWRVTRVVRLSATTAACVVLACWLISIAAYVCVPYARARAVALGGGSFIIQHGLDFTGNPLRFRAGWAPVQFSAGWSSMSASWGGKGTATAYYYPVWPALVALLIPSVVLWLLIPRPIPPGHCQHCGYDLTGNVSGRCPECGQGISREESRP